MVPLKINSDYLRCIFNPKTFKIRLNNTIELAKELKTKYNYEVIAFKGNSGSAMAYSVANAIGCGLFLVRDETSPHYFIGESKRKRSFEGVYNFKRYIILDDFISTGATFLKIKSTVKKIVPKAKLVASIMYDQSCKDYSTFSGCKLFFTKLK